MTTPLSPKNQLDPQKTTAARAIIAQSNRIAIISHRHPDPDTIGSNICLKQALNSWGKQVHSLCIDPPPGNCQFLQETDQFTSELNPPFYDLLITVDCGSRAQAGFPALQEEYSANTPFLLNIDHHASNDHFGNLALVCPELSSTAEIIYALLESWQIPLNKAMATALLTGLYFDTGSFMHSNVTANVLKIASVLAEKGADLKAIRQNLFQNFTENKYHLWGETLETLKISDKGTAIGVITEEMIKESHTSSEGLSGLIDYVSMAKGSDFALLIKQEKDDQIRGSLRTHKEEINVSEMAMRLGGGGHRKASGFSFPAKLEKQSIWTIIN